MKKHLGRIAAAAVCAAATARAPAAAPPAAVRPNVLFIALDDLNDWIGCLGGHPQARTPNLDRLAASGMLFTAAYCAAASCNPSRTALLSGIPPHRSGLYTNLQKMRQVIPDAVLLPRWFSRHGYWSAGSGKILHYIIDAPSWDAYYPRKESENPFPPFYDFGKRPKTLPYEPWMYRETDWGGFDAADDEFKGDALVARWVGEQLRKPHDRPFFLACGIYRPHEPWFVPQRYFDLFPDKDIQLPPGVLENDLDDVPPMGQRIGRNRYLAHIRTHGLWHSGVRAYLASIAYADAMVGRVLDALDEGPHRDRTIVVLWSDHGWHLGEKEHWQKYTGWRVCARVPLMIRVPAGAAPGLPDGTAPGGRCARPVSLIDLYRTLTDLCGLPANPGATDRSLVPLLADPSAPWPHAALTHLGDPGNYAVSLEEWRYIHYARGGEELYRLPDDPYEWRNLAGAPEHRETLERMRALAPKTIAPMHESPLPAEPEGALTWTAADGEPPPSTAGGARTTVFFENRRAGPVSLLWIDPEGRRVSYGRLESGERRPMKTFAGHVWLAADDEGRPIGFIRAGKPPSAAVIEAP